MAGLRYTLDSINYTHVSYQAVLISKIFKSVSPPFIIPGHSCKHVDDFMLVERIEQSQLVSIFSFQPAPTGYARPIAETVPLAFVF